MKVKLQKVHEKFLDMHIIKFVLLMALLTVIVFFILYPFHILFPMSEEFYLKYGKDTIWTYITAIVVSPIWETLLFQTLFLGKYVKLKSKKKWKDKNDLSAILIVALIFGALHYIGRDSIGKVISATGMGIVINYAFITLVKRKDKATIWTIVIHSLMNIILIVIGLANKIIFLN